MSTALWILVGIGAWLVLSVVVALVYGRVVRMRDRQVPDPPPRPGPPSAAPPEQRGPVEPPPGHLPPGPRPPG